MNETVVGLMGCALVGLSGLQLTLARHRLRGGLRFVVAELSLPLFFMTVGIEWIHDTGLLRLPGPLRLIIGCLVGVSWLALVVLGFRYGSFCRWSARGREVVAARRGRNHGR